MTVVPINVTLCSWFIPCYPGFDRILCSDVLVASSVQTSHHNIYKYTFSSANAHSYVD